MITEFDSYVSHMKTLEIDTTKLELPHEVASKISNNRLLGMQQFDSELIFDAKLKMIDNVGFKYISPESIVKMISGEDVYIKSGCPSPTEAFSQILYNNYVFGAGTSKTNIFMWKYSYWPRFHIPFFPRWIVTMMPLSAITLKLPDELSNKLIKLSKSCFFNCFFAFVHSTKRPIIITGALIKNSNSERFPKESWDDFAFAKFSFSEFNHYFPGAV